ncbi:GNAT family N-acetyltransferase [Streptomyces sp. NPDC055036]
MPALLAPVAHQPWHSTAARNSAVAVELRRSAAEVPARQWDALVDLDAFYSSHRWIRSLERVHGSQPVLTATAGRLAEVTGVLPTWTTTDTDTSGLFSLPGMTQGLIGTPSRQALWLGPRRATATTITCARGTSRTRSLRALMEAARRLAADRGLAGAVWPYLTGAHALEAAACHPLAQAVLHTADAFVRVPPDGMRGITAVATSKSRHQVRRERSSFVRSGTIEWTTLTAGVCTRIAPLLAATRDKYGSPGGTSLMRRTLEAQRSSGVAAQAVVALARTRNDDVIRAAALFYRHGDTLYGRYWGSEATAPPFSYFNLTFYEAVDWAARHGMRSLHLSVPATAAKLRRGATTRPLALIWLPASGQDTRIGLHALRRHNHRVAQEWNPVTHGEAWAHWISSGK